LILKEKYKLLKENIKKLGSIAVAFSGGVDSTLLAKVCNDVLGKGAIAITIVGPMHSKKEIEEANELAREIGIKHIKIELDKEATKDFKNNPEDRCYFCKHKVFSTIINEAKKHGIKYIADGSNVDDLDDYRPGLKAIEELDVKSPLKESGLTKEDIRKISKDLKLQTWDKPAFSCLLTRLPHGEEITEEKLRMIEKCENYISSLGFNQYRVRYHGEIARIEVAPEERDKFFDTKILDDISKEFKKIGFKYVTMDLEGYRMGKMNKEV